MGTGGTGDVLTGMLAGVDRAVSARRWVRVLAFGVYLHGLAGDIAYAETGEAPLLASDLIRADSAGVSAILCRVRPWVGAKSRRIRRKKPSRAAGKLARG